MKSNLLQHKLMIPKRLTFSVKRDCKTTLEICMETDSITKQEMYISEKEHEIIQKKQNRFSSIKSDLGAS